ncbi:MAG: hypothetical protein M3Q73_04165 [bacterium]|nr:hypothetical protein [bacterium]
MKKMPYWLGGGIISVVVSLAIVLIGFFLQKGNNSPFNISNTTELLSIVIGFVIVYGFIFLIGSGVGMIIGRFLMRNTQSAVEPHQNKTETSENIPIPVRPKTYPFLKFVSYASLILLPLCILILFAMLGLGLTTNITASEYILTFLFMLLAVIGYFFLPIFVIALGIDLIMNSNINKGVKMVLIIVLIFVCWVLPAVISQELFLAVLKYFPTNPGI